MHQEPCRVEVRPPAGQLPLDHLELGDRPSELLAVLRVRGGYFERGRRQSDGERADPDAAAVEHALDVFERPALGADPVALGHAAVRDDDLRRVRGVQAHLLFASARAEAGRAARDAEGT